ncbi:hypothetical protein IJM86_01155 [bacterium]|nr:hypothetical protein [bacterium]
MITLEKFNELLMHFNAFPGEKELSNYQKYNYSNDIYRGLVEKLYTQISTVKNKQKKIKNEFTNLYNEIQKIFTSLNNVHKLTNGKPREEYYNNIFSDLKQLEIYAKTGACTIMRTRRQNACELIVSS